jgi:hypothetical protein
MWVGESTSGDRSGSKGRGEGRSAVERTFNKLCNFSFRSMAGSIQGDRPKGKCRARTGPPENALARSHKK